MKTQPSAPAAASALLAYVAALEGKDIQAIKSLIQDHTLIELPFLKPNRLVSEREITSGHEAIFANLDGLKFSLREPVETDCHAIVEGALNVRRKSGEEHTHQVGIVAEIDGETLTRLSLYADARNIRPWCDKTIL